ncbi:hypothetical protein [Streptomyces sp. URMC 129]|uniref:hypothetical protein n=1 Tax=Streptomyces sp. URMC 129 TaxID=3423407 RepID=UPI003F1DCEFD
MSSRPLADVLRDLLFQTAPEAPTPAREAAVRALMHATGHDEQLTEEQLQQHAAELRSRPDTIQGRADLTDANLTRANLTGSVWSLETEWPAALYMDIRSRSEEIEPGLFRIRGAESTDRSGAGLDSGSPLPAR